MKHNLVSNNNNNSNMQKLYVHVELNLCFVFFEHLNVKMIPTVPMCYDNVINYVQTIGTVTTRQSTR